MRALTPARCHRETSGLHGTVNNVNSSCPLRFESILPPPASCFPPSCLCILHARRGSLGVHASDALAAIAGLVVRVAMRYDSTMALQRLCFVVVGATTLASCARQALRA